MSRANLSKLLLAFAAVFLAMAIATLIPHDAPVLSDLGYQSWCPFAPYSTLALLFGAGLCQAVRKHMTTLPVS
jgi:hypothetical protein